MALRVYRDPPEIAGCFAYMAKSVLFWFLVIVISTAVLFTAIAIQLSLIK
jgi:hypothetical protein